MEFNRPMHRTVFAIVAVTAFLLLGLTMPRFVSAQVSIESRYETSGVIARVNEGSIEIRDEAGELVTLKIQDQGEDAILLDSVRIRLRFPADIEVSGEFPIDYLTPGQLIRANCQVSRTGRTRGEVDTIEIPDADSSTIGVELSREHDRDNPYVDATVTGEIIQIRNSTVGVQVPGPNGRRPQRINLLLNDQTVVRVNANRLEGIKPGDKIESATVARLSSGDHAVEAIKITLANRVADAAESTQEARYRRLSDEPSAPRDVRSEHFILHTDISDRQAQILLDKLETMAELIATYYGRMTPKVIECYVVRDLRQWPQGSLDPDGAAKIARGEGVTMSRTLRGQTQAIVYSCDKHGVVQHEAVHAFCSQTFGSTGPTWYSEGMAEMGQYWKKDRLAVQVDDVVINYLTRSEPKAMLDIVAAGQITGDSWQAYAWRWALCHLLASNPNYASQFKTLGLAMMRGRPDSFESTYGPVAREISFEYDQFVQNMGNGYRADLCAWQWNARVVNLRLRRPLKSEVVAKGGWQTTKIRVEEGWEIKYEAIGEWKTSEVGDATGADGDASGSGKLIAVILDDYQLTEPFELGESGTFIAPTSGDLYIRCQDSWTKLDDNSGSLEVSFERLASDR